MSKNKKNNAGRKTVMNDDVVDKLEDAFMMAFSDEESCLYAGISVDALYDYQLKNPEFTKRKKTLRLHPNMAAKKELVVGIKGNIAQARWWAQNKMNDEFGERTTIKHDMSEGGKEMTEGVTKAITAFNETMRTILTKKKSNENKKQ